MNVKMTTKYLSVFPPPASYLEIPTVFSDVLKYLMSSFKCNELYFSVFGQSYPSPRLSLYGATLQVVNDNITFVVYVNELFLRHWQPIDLPDILWLTKTKTELQKTALYPMPCHGGITFNRPLGALPPGTVAASPAPGPGGRTA